MIVGGQKRLRDTLVEKMEAAAQETARTAHAAASVKVALTSRLASSTPPFWRHAASAIGISGVDAFLVHLGQSVSTAIDETRASAEAARRELTSTRDALYAAIEARFVELAASINSVEERKVAALDSELVKVNGGLRLKLLPK